MLLKDKTALVTGIGSGIGRAAALLFAEHGAQVSGLDINEEAGHEVIEAIKARGGEGLFVQTDVTNDSAVRSAIQTTIDTLGHINVAFNVVGASGRRHGDGPVHQCTEEGWDWTMDVNLKSMYLCCKYLVEDMLDQGGGAIVNLASVLGLVGGDEDFSTHAYAASKGAVISLTRSMASYYAPSHIRANVICPSLIATAMSKRAQSNDHIIGRLPSLQPLTGDFGTPEDVAEAALYLLSDNAKFVTGSVLTVDGGWTVR